MRSPLPNLRRLEFEARIFVSFAIVAAVLTAAYTLSPGAATTGARLGRWVGLSAEAAHRASFVVAAGIVALATLLRMTAGSMLTSKRVMAFKVQRDALVTRGAYRLTRNPIYLADWTAFVGFALVLPPVGLLLPVLLHLHYHQLIGYEERALAARFGDRYEAFLRGAPRFLPTPASLARLPRALGEMEINRDGVRHNALYVLFLPGLVVGASTGEFWHALVIGLPATLDWAVVHTRIGLTHDAPEEGKVPHAS